MNVMLVNPQQIVRSYTRGLRQGFVAGIIAGAVVRYAVRRANELDRQWAKDMMN